MKQGIYKIEKFLGINESPDGDTGLKMGEASDMINYKITKEGNLQLRSGYKSVSEIADGKPIRGMWIGYVDGIRRWLVACNGHVYSINFSTKAKTDLGTLTDGTTTFFPFANNVYILNSKEYKKWDGTTFSDVVGYTPVIRVACTPATGAGTALQQVNKLTGSKWLWYSGDGATTFKLPETDITSVDTVTVGGVTKTATTHYTVNLTNSTVNFTNGNEPGTGTNNVKIKYTKGTGHDRSTVLSQRFCEAYNGFTDNRVFLYGDGTNKAYYSDLEHTTGKPTAEYFPDLNVLDVGEDNTPITSVIRNFNKLMTFKLDGTYMTDFDYITLSDGTVTAGFYTQAIEKDIGNTPYGQVKLINNYPVSLHGNSAYRWGLIYSSGTQDERAAKIISDKVQKTLSTFDMEKVVTFDDEWNREFWLLNDGKACVYNYANEADANSSYKNNVWYIYDNINATCFVSVDGELYFGSDDGYIMHVSRKHRNDNGEKITALWESGSMAFDAEYMRKLISKAYVSLKPESGGKGNNDL